MAEPLPTRKSFVARALDIVERAGNALPDPALLFVVALVLVAIVSWLLSGTEFRVAKAEGDEIRTVVDLLTAAQITRFGIDLVHIFTGFHPLGVVLVALLGVGVAERSGFIDVGLQLLLSFTPRIFLTPVLLVVGILSHAAADAGYVLVIPLGGAIFLAAGRHPLAGIVAAFAGVSGGFSANFIPSAVDPLLQGITQAAGQLSDPTLEVNPLCNIYFTAASSLLIVVIGWFLTDYVIEPRLRAVAVDGDPENLPRTERVTPVQRTAFFVAVAAVLLAGLGLVVVSWPIDSPLRHEGSLTSSGAPLMKMIVPLIFVFFLLPGIVHGYVARKFTSHRDVIKAMSTTMSTMGYYLVMAFFAALFIEAFGRSNLGAFLAVRGAEFLKSTGASAAVTVVGVILICTMVNLLVGSASAKWALLAPIFVPMLMQLGIAPELTQAAYRVGDSSTNIITPLMPYFPLVVAFAQRYVRSAGLGTVASLMLPYSLCFLVLWTVFLLGYWTLDLPLGVNAAYEYSRP